MATRIPAVTYAPNGHRQLLQVIWSALATGDDGAAVEIPTWADRSVQISGTFGGATVTLQGSNDGISYHALTDPQGNDIAKTAAALEQVSEITRFVKCICAGGAGSALIANLLARRT